VKSIAIYQRTLGYVADHIATLSETAQWIGPGNWRWKRQCLMV